MSSYKIGYLIELRARDDLKKLGASLVVRSARSLTPIDLIAFFPDKKEIWLVQVKGKVEAPEDEEKLKEEFKDLVKLKGEYICRSFVFMKKEGRYKFLEVK
jgi:Holliday junction resolvase-like predicted endonuclease